MTSTPIRAADQTWLHMDRLDNLLHVRCLMWLEAEPDLDTLRALLQERLVDRHPVLRRRASERDGEWFWEDADDFDVADHVRLVRLDGDDAALRTWIGERFAEPFTPGRPLWSADLVTGIEGRGAALFCRVHHAVTDGVRLVQLMFSLCETEAGGTVPLPVGRPPRTAGLLGSAAAVVRRATADLADLALGSTRAPLRLATSLSPRLLPQGLGLVRHPHRLIDLVQGLSSTDNQTVNTVAELGRVLTASRTPRTAWTGRPGVEKSVAWVTDLDLAHVRALGREHGGTVNDVLVALVAQALTRYLAEKDALVDEVAWMVPVTLRPFDESLPEELGNHFSLVFLPMPLGSRTPRQAVAAVRQRMERIKNSLEPVVTFGVQWAVAESPRLVAHRVTNLLADKAVGVLTNVPGPRRPVRLAGMRVTHVLGWVPSSGHQPLGVCLFSYAGAVTVGIAADTGLVPDPDRIAELIEEEYRSW
ncbi:WS/DGAT domain-containing protein [Nocardioides daphniae]|uniref:diacylglycerol O-acyltransferase n=1 Tax=Nocardioides daphniae TaxID=402297 RepID=A0A4V1CWS7_9ACTN|nr:WS/DGAT domain-containing protein [Nocardioides daphniae]QCC78307.1 DUF1298 domain-containing protein [Nocardioides daphniae]GGD13695.1 hypothetical protein GCM10007231_10970 [Nocardioides daphniae]